MTSDREDGFGNKIRYVPGQGFVIDNTPITQDILDQQQREELSTLREDLPRQRAERVRRDNRSIRADEHFNTLFDAMTSNRQPTREESESESILRAMDSRNRPNNNANSDSAIREGRRLNPQTVRNSGTNLVDTIANAEQSGRDSFYQNQGNENTLQLSLIDAMRQIAGDVSNVNGPNVGYSDNLSQRADAALGASGGAVQSSMESVGNAFGNLQQAAGREIDLSGLMSVAGNIDNERNERLNPTEQMTLSHNQNSDLYQAMLRQMQSRQNYNQFRSNQGVF